MEGKTKIQRLHNYRKTNQPTLGTQSAEEMWKIHLERRGKSGAFSYRSPKALLVMEGLQMSFVSIYQTHIKKMSIFFNVR